MTILLGSVTEARSMRHRIRQRDQVRVRVLYEAALREGLGGAGWRCRLPQYLFVRAQVTGGRSVLRIEGFKHSNLKTGAPNEREAHQPAAPAHDRRHDGAQLRREDAQRLYPARQYIYSLSRPRAGYGRA